MTMCRCCICFASTEEGFENICPECYAKLGCECGEKECDHEG